METLLLLAHTEPDGSLAQPALEALGAAKNLEAQLTGAKLLVGLSGRNIQPAAERIAACGPEKVLGVMGTDFAQPRYATDAAAAEALAKAAQATLIIAPATSRWNRVLSGVAQRLHGRVDTHVTALSAADGSPSINRWYYRQRMEALIRRKQRPWFMLLEPGTQPAWSGETAGTTVEIIPVNLRDTCKRTEVVGVRELAKDVQTIRPDASLLLVAGAGWTKKQADGKVHLEQAERLILDCLKHARASLGSSKSLLDLGGEGQAVLSFLTHLNQIGQTGSTPRHPKGLATCCHGEEPHTVGWRFINERRAINLDPNCGWARGKADVLYVADAFAVMAKVNELLAASGGQ